MNNLNKEVLDIEISGIRRFYNMISDNKDIISLTIGQPDFPTPSHIKEAAKIALDNNLTNYSHNAGFIDLREAISNWMIEKYDLSYDPYHEILVSTGSSQALDITFRSILNPGDEVILPAPIYPGYEPLIKMCKAKSILVDTRSTNFKLTPKQLDEHINSKTKAVVIPYPSNPTGAVLSHNETYELASYLSNKDVYVIADELYSELIFAGKHTSIASFKGMKNKTIVINGLSKSHSMTGWRIGVALAPKELMSNMIKVHQYNVTCASSISQRAAFAAYTNGFDDAKPMSKAYYNRVRKAFDKFQKNGIDVNMPGGTFYIFPEIKKPNMTSLELAVDLVEKAGVALIPGSAFSHFGEGYLRLSCACSEKVLDEGLARIESYLTRYL